MKEVACRRHVARWEFADNLQTSRREKGIGRQPHVQMSLLSRILRRSLWQQLLLELYRTLAATLHHLVAMSLRHNMTMPAVR